MRTAILFSILLAPAAFAAISGNVIDEQGAPIAGATIKAFPSESYAELYERLKSEKPERTPITTAQSDANGTFRIDTARTPVVILTFTAPSRTPLSFDAADGEDVGAVLLRKTAVRKGRITMNGKPVANAVIGSRAGFITRSDASGAFEVPEPSAGDRWFAWHPESGVDEVPFRSPSLEMKVQPGITVRGRVVGPDGKPVAHAALDVGGTMYGQSAEDGTFTLQQVYPGWTAIVARNGDRVGLVLRSAKPPYEIRLRPGASLTGAIRDAKTQAPVGGVRLTLATEQESQYTLTDAKGNFTFPAMPAAQYRLIAWHPAYVVNAPEVELREGRRESRTLNATPYARISGTVTDEDRKPVAAATVSARSFAFGGGSTRNAVTNRAGEFTIRAATLGPPPTLEASKEGYATTTTSVTVGEGETKSGVALRLTRGAPLKLTVVDPDRVPMPGVTVSFFRVTGESAMDMMPVAICAAPSCNVTDADGTLDLRVAPGRYELRLIGDAIVMKSEPVTVAAKPQPLTLTVEHGVDVSGRVVYSDGTAVPDVWVRSGGGMQPSVARTDAGGAFTMHGLRRGQQTLTAETMSRFAAAPKQVTAPASDVVITLPKPGKVSGRVVDAASTQPVTQFSVAVVRRGGFSSPMPSTPFRADDGTFTVDVPPGSYELQVAAPGYARGTATGIEVEEGKNAENVEVKLERGARLAGRVTSGGAPVSGATVRVQDSASPAAMMMMPDRNPPQAVTDANGDYLLDSLAPGERTISVNKDGYVAQRKTVEVSAAREARLDVELVRGRELRGRVVDESGQPVANAEVHQQVGMFPTYGQIRSDSDGVFRLGNLADTPLTIVVSKSGYMDAKVENVDPASSVTVTLRRGGTIAGRVTGLTPEELQQTSVMAMTFGTGTGSRSEARPDANGNFVVQGIPDGKVNVMAMVRTGSPMRRSPMKSVDVVNGTAPPVEIAFGGGYTVRGRVTRAGRVVNDVYISFQPGDMQKQTPVTADVRAGEYEAGGLSAGQYAIVVRSGSAILLREEYTVAGDARHDLEVRGVSIRGRVVDARTSAPLAETLVMVDITGTRATTDSSGMFVLDVAGDGTVQLRTQRQRYQPATRDVTVTGGQAPFVELQLEPAEASSVRVVDAMTMRPLEAWVNVMGHDRKSAFSTRSSADDGVAKVFVAPGSYAVSVTSQGYAVGNATLAVPGPEVQVMLTRGGTVVVQSRSAEHVRGMLTRAGGMPIPIFDSALNVPAGSYTLEVVGAGDKVAGKYPVTVVEGQTVTVAVD
ncbi:MAG TPA: carboxypeptidase regulatory-like domain-containing protein [Thermoanaerobaculia bacterium]|nr:carboxypeptidase regulatory-like domain-containing protein [Thermoanaerobaculia bacterium]